VKKITARKKSIKNNTVVSQRI